MRYYDVSISLVGNTWNTHSTTKLQVDFIQELAQQKIVIIPFYIKTYLFYCLYFWLDGLLFFVNCLGYVEEEYRKSLANYIKHAKWKKQYLLRKCSIKHCKYR